MAPMPNVKGLDSFPRSYSDEIPRHHIPYLEDIRRAGNAVRALRRRGLPHASAQLRFTEACQRFDALVSRETAARDNPALF